MQPIGGLLRLRETSRCSGDLGYLIPLINHATKSATSSGWQALISPGGTREVGEASIFATDLVIRKCFSPRFRSSRARYRRGVR
jgi:hypothetical protein